jgi:zinc transporter 1/2/3
MRVSTAELKLVFAAAIFLVGAVGVLVPWVRRSGRADDRFMIWGDTFAGGVLGGAGLVHLLSSGADGFSAVAPGSTYPLAFVLAGAGFLLILLIEAVIVADPDPSRSPLQRGEP